MIAGLLSIVAAAIVLFAVLWVEQSGAAKPKFQFQLADVVSLAILLQVELALFVATNLPTELERRGGRASVLAGSMIVFAFLFWITALRELDNVGMKIGWRRTVFTVFILPATLSLAFCASYAVVLASQGLKGFWVQFLATTWPYDYQHLGVGHPPFNQQLGYAIGGFLLFVASTAILKLAHRRLLLP